MESLTVLIVYRTVHFEHNDGTEGDILSETYKTCGYQVHEYFRRCYTEISNRVRFYVVVLRRWGRGTNLKNA